MKIKFHGVSNGYAYENQNLGCICLDDKILLDCGITNFPRPYFDSLDALFLSHGHKDHIVGISSLTLGLAVETDRKARKERDFCIYSPAGIKEKIEDRIDSTYKDRVGIIELNPGDKFRFLDEYEIKTAKVEHKGDCLAYRFEKDGKSFVYTGDAVPSQEVIDLSKNVDVLIHEASFVNKFKEKASSWKHSTSEQAAEVAQKSGAKTLILTLISPHVRLNNMEEYLTEAQNVFLGKIIIASEGLIYEL
ncbi:MAG: MBL fold metallo-hydrolase [Candidatus Nanoarchaeia archaeon]|nr:MBL fold metallo-hydrolase [Candidatus Nanoarchaeia archaeon]MDD5239744.1 MBL fold metallo-hydrolase [Candidatus Nanoarchaeia archaeon]